MSQSATKLYFLQRITGSIMIPLSIWMLLYLIPQIGNVYLQNNTFNTSNIIHIFQKKSHIVYIILFIICAMYHGILGINSIIHDYIHCSIAKKLLFVIVYGIAIFTIISCGVFCIDMYMICNSYS